MLGFVRCVHELHSLFNAGIIPRNTTAAPPVDPQARHHDSKGHCLRSDQGIKVPYHTTPWKYAESKKQKTVLCVCRGAVLGGPPG